MTSLFRRKRKYSFSCKDVGMNCGYEIRNASSEEELLEILMIHVREEHNSNEISRDVLNNIKRNIKKS
jgi:predicted small metal-binding protein